MRGRARRAGRGQGAAAGARDPQYRPRRHARARHHRRLARQCRSGGGNVADRGDARRHLELSRRRQDRRDPGARLPHRADDHQPAGRRLSDRRALSGLAGQSRHRLSRGERAQQRFRLRLGGGAGRAWRRRQMQTHRHRRRRRDRPPHPAGQRRAAIDRRHARRRRRCAPRSRKRSPISRRSTTCTPRPPIAAASPPCWPRAPSPMRSPMRKGKNPMRIELNVNGTLHATRGRAAHHAARLPARPARSQGRPCRLRARRLRRLHRAVRRRGGALLPDVRRAGGGLRRSPPSRASRPAPANCRRSRTPSAKRTACNAAIARRP